MWGQFWSQKSRKPTQVLKMDYVALDVEELLSLYVGMRRGTSFDLISVNAFILPICVFFLPPYNLPLCLMIQNECSSLTLLFL